METLRIDGRLYATWSNLSTECQREARNFFATRAPYLPHAAYFYRVHPDGKILTRWGRYIPPSVEQVLKDEWTVRQIQES